MISNIALAMALASVLSTAGAQATADSQAARSASTASIPNTKVKDMKVRIRVGDKAITATLVDSVAARDFLSLLPLTMDLKDYASTEKISDLPRKLSIEGSPDGSTPSAGDIAYYAPWGNLAIFYKGFRYSKGLVKLGSIDSGRELLERSDSFQVTIELIRQP